MSLVLDAFLKALIGGLVDAFNAWRRDKALEDLGYTKAQRDAANASLTQANAVIAAEKRMADVQPLDSAGAAQRLRNGNF